MFLRVQGEIGEIYIVRNVSWGTRENCLNLYRLFNRIFLYINTSFIFQPKQKATMVLPFVRMVGDKTKSKIILVTMALPFIICWVTKASAKLSTKSYQSSCNTNQTFQNSHPSIISIYYLVEGLLCLYGPYCCEPVEDYHFEGTARNN